MDKRVFKDKVYGILANMIKAMANPHRLEIVDLLGQGEKTVEQIAAETHVSVANASQHLQVLKAVNLVDTRRDGNYIYYKITNDNIYKCWQTFRQMGQSHVAEMDRLVKDFREKRNSLQAIEIDQLVKKIKSKDVVLLDVRPADEYRNGHIPGAMNIPVHDLPLKMKKFAKNKEYVAYCRGPFCVFADDAVDLLTRSGFRAKRLEQGFPEWKVKGLPVEWELEN